MTEMSPTDSRWQNFAGKLVSTWFFGNQFSEVYEDIVMIPDTLVNTVDKGIFFILPCIDAYARVDLRTRTYDIPPQE
ncbi:hypothetical protein HHI36_018596, partial [Cryptolaemus montrouzieri]